MLTYKQQLKAPTTTLNDIPCGTIFYGEIRGNSPSSSHHVYKGVWLRTGPYESVNLMAVGLTMEHRIAGTKNAPIFRECVPVHNYRALTNPTIVEGI